MMRAAGQAEPGESVWGVEVAEGEDEDDFPDYLGGFHEARVRILVGIPLKPEPVSLQLLNHPVSVGQLPGLDGYHVTEVDGLLP